MEDTDKLVQNSLVRLYPKLKRFALSLTGSMDRADDLVQHACEIALRQSSRGLCESHIDSWLYHLMRRTWIAQQKPTDLRTSTPLADADDLADLDSRSQADDRLMLDAVYRELMRLPTEQRTVLTLVCIRS